MTSTRVRAKQSSAEGTLKADWLSAGETTPTQRSRWEAETQAEGAEGGVEEQAERRGERIAQVAHEQRRRHERRPAIAHGERARRRRPADVCVGRDEQQRAGPEARAAWPGCAQRAAGAEDEREVDGVE